MDNVADIYPLSPIQLGMLFHTLAGEAGIYVNQYTCQLQGAVDAERLQQAWQQTIDHHPVLRTAFLWEGLDEPLQVVRQQVTLPWQVLDWRGAEDVEDRLEAFLRCDRTHPFNLAQAPLLRLTLIHLSETHTQLVWTSHHLLFDGWSLPLIWQDLLSWYQGQRPTPRRPYRDFIAWQQQQSIAASEPFWREQLKPVSAPTPLPAALTSGVQTNHYQQHTQRLTPQRTTALTTFTRQQRLTLNTLVQAAWALLLHHYSGQSQVTYGSVVSGRPATMPGVEKMVGLFINTLPVSMEIEPSTYLADWLQQRQQQLLDLRQHEITPLQTIQRWTGLSGSDLFDSIVVFENYPTTAAADLPFTVENARYIEQSNYPLALLVLPGTSLELILLYDTGRFEAGAIRNLLDHLTMLLTAFTEQPQAKLAELPRLTPPAQQFLRSPSVTLDAPGYVHRFIESQAQATPDAIAVQFGQQSLTYAALNRQANQLAGQIRDYIPPLTTTSSSPFVAICLERSVELVVAILAVLKAGAAYVPLDPTYPEARLSYCLQDTQPQLLLTQQAVTLPDSACPRLYQEDWETDRPTENLGLPVHPDDLAYVIYTSGSTGQPKGVKVSQRNLTHSTTARFQVYPDPVERF
ncbi:MAG: condensation domain-containing protein, partial [Cyanobacteria bacterium J06632_22]